MTYWLQGKPGMRKKLGCQYLPEATETSKRRGPNGGRLTRPAPFWARLSPPTALRRLRLHSGIPGTPRVPGLTPHAVRQACWERRWGRKTGQSHCLTHLRQPHGTSQRVPSTTPDALKLACRKRKGREKCGRRHHPRPRRRPHEVPRVPSPTPRVVPHACPKGRERRKSRLRPRRKPLRRPLEVHPHMTGVAHRADSPTPLFLTSRR